VEADGIIIATGSKPASIPVLEVEEVGVIKGEEALELKELPRRVLIVSGGPMGIEFSILYRMLGSGVYLSKAGRVKVDKVILSVGRVPNTEGIGLREMGVKLNSKGTVIVDEFMRTNVGNVFAAGDVIGRYFLAYTAYAEGEVAAENATGNRVKVDYGNVPIAVFSYPEVASVGLIEEKARKLYETVRKGVYPFSANGRAISTGITDGFMKATNCVKDLIEALYIHPSSSEALKEAALTALGKPLHV